MFGWFAKKEERPPYVNPFKIGDKVVNTWTYYNEGSLYQHRFLEPHDKNWDYSKLKDFSDPKFQWDIFAWVIRPGMKGVVTGIIRDNAVVKFDDLPCEVIMFEEGLKKDD